MDPHPRYALGIDVGGTKIAGGLLRTATDGSTPRILARQIVATRAERGGRAVLDEVLRLGRELAVQAPQEGTMTAVGIGLCELVNRQGHPASANCIDWLNLAVHAELARIASSAAVNLEADVRAAARAEAVLGAGRGCAVFLYVTIGTGISCCLMVEGQPFLGAQGATGTMGSSPLWVPATAAASPTLEEVSSGPGLVQRFNAAGGSATCGQDVLRAARAEDPIAIEVVRSAAEALGAQLAILIGTLDPEALVIGGGLGLSEGPYWDQFTDATRRRVWSERQRQIPIRRAATGPDAGWIGAALAALAKSPQSPYHHSHDH